VYASTPSTNLDRGLPSRVARVPSHGSRSPDASAGSRLKATVPGRLLEAQSSTPGPDTLSVKTGRSLAPRSHSSPRHDHRAASHHRSLATTPSPPPGAPQRRHFRLPLRPQGERRTSKRSTPSSLTPPTAASPLRDSPPPPRRLHALRRKSHPLRNHSAQAVDAVRPPL